MDSEEFIRWGLRRGWPKGHPELRKQCLEWSGGSNKDGYGRVRFLGQMWFVHRLIAYLAGWKIEGKDVHHVCENRCCFELEHLEVLAHSKHVGGDRNGSCLHPEKVPRGERHWSAKLTVKDVRLIRKLYMRGGISQRMLGYDFGLGQMQISRIIRKVRWKHV